MNWIQERLRARVNAQDIGCFDWGLGLALILTGCVLLAFPALAFSAYSNDVSSIAFYWLLGGWGFFCLLAGVTGLKKTGDGEARLAATILPLKKPHRNRVG